MSEAVWPQPEQHDLLARLAPGGAEDFITECLCWLLGRSAFGRHFLAKLAERMEPKAGIAQAASSGAWETQYSLGWTRKRPDMVCVFEGGKSALIFEHKVDASLGEDQIGSYGRIAARRFDESPIILVTARKDQCEQKPDCHVLWRDIYGWLSCWLQDSRDDNAEFVALSFLYLLKQRGLGPMGKVEPRQLASIPTAQIGKGWIESLVGRMAEEWPETVSAPLKRPEGRGGIFLLGDGDPSTWNPDIFVGVMVDGSDHGPPTVNDERGDGPVACVVLDIHRRWDYEDKASYQTLAEWACGDWLREHRGWGIFVSRNRYHPIVAYRPLCDVIDGAATGEGQLELFVREVRQVASTLQEHPAFGQLRQELQPDYAA